MDVPTSIRRSRRTLEEAEHETLEIGAEDRESVKRVVEMDSQFVSGCTLPKNDPYDFYSCAAWSSWSGGGDLTDETEVRSSPQISHSWDSF